MTIPITPAQFDGFRPGRLWSLWKIMKHFATLADLLRRLWNWEIDLSARRNVPLDLESAENLRGVTSKDLHRITKLLGEIKSALGYMEWESAHDRITLIFRKLQPGITVDELHIEIEGLNHTIREELRRRWFCYLPQTKAQRQRSGESEWALTIKSFQASEMEIKAALSCYATGNDTAAVFHLMRVAEIGLRALAKERKVTLSKSKPIEWGTWQEIITALETEVRKIGTTNKAGAAKDRALAFYSGAIADLNAFKDEYRNQVMHLRVMYDEHQSLRTIERVHAFMQRISAKIDSRHYRIRWGLK